jgi:hypothetical protein
LPGSNNKKVRMKKELPALVLVIFVLLVAFVVLLVSPLPALAA